MRLLHIVKFFPPDPGGMEYFARDLTLEQAKSGHEVLVLGHASLTQPGLTKPGLTKPAPGLTVSRHPVWFSLGDGYAPVAPSLIWAIRAALIKFKPDLIHLHCPNPAGGAVWLPFVSAPIIIQWQADVIFPSDRRPPAWLLAPWNLLEKGLVQKARRIITTSPDYAASSHRLQNYQDKCRVVPLGLPLASPPAKSGPVTNWLAEKKPGSRILAIGRLSHYKGFPFLLKALAQVPQAHLCLIGDGEERANLEKLVAELGLEGRVLLAGQVDSGQCQACLELTDLLCLPSLERSESFGLVLLEAMRAGKPCLATSVPGSGMSLAVKHMVNGLLVAPGQVDALAAALKTLLENPTLRETLGLSGRQRFLTEFTLPHICNLVANIYQEVMGGG